MKKTFFLFALLLFPVFSFASVTYERTPEGDDISAPVSFVVSIDDWLADTAIEIPENSTWGLLYDHNNQNGFEGDYMSYGCYSTSETQNAYFVDSLPLNFPLYGLYIVVYDSPSCVFDTYYAEYELESGAPAFTVTSFNPFLFDRSSFEVTQMRNALLVQAYPIMLGVLGAFIGFALIFMSARFVLRKFKNWTKMRAQL